MLRKYWPYALAALGVIVAIIIGVKLYRRAAGPKLYRDPTGTWVTSDPKTQQGVMELAMQESEVISRTG